MIAHVRFASKADKRPDISLSLLCAKMYGPAVRCKTDFRERRT